MMIKNLNVPIDDVGHTYECFVDDAACSVIRGDCSLEVAILEAKDEAEDNYCLTPDKLLSLCGKSEADYESDVRERIKEYNSDNCIVR